MSDFEQALGRAAEAIEEELDLLLPPVRGPEARVLEAMRYAVLGGGKRLRPFLVLESAQLFAVERRSALRVAAAVECVHTYTLVHDDLPCMDDDAMRRGRAATHIRYDEATAVLAGDALLTFAFEVLADPGTHEDPYVRCELVARLAEAAGCHGMVGGQMIDIEAENGALDAPAITRMQQMKTGQLIAFACEAGAILGHGDPSQRQSLRAFAHDLGLAFQITDDLLDQAQPSGPGEQARLGKTPGKDAAAGKQTLVALLGVERARDQAEMLAAQAIVHLNDFDHRADLLRDMARYVVNRRS